MAVSMTMVLLMVVMVVMAVAASLPGEDHGSDAAYGLGPGLGQQRRRGLGTGLAGLRHARRDSPETSGVEKDVPLQRHMPAKFRTWPIFGGSVHMYSPVAYALTSPSPGANTSTHGP